MNTRDLTNELVTRGYSPGAKVFDYLSLFLASVMVLLSFLFLSLSVFAALPPEVTTAFTTLTTDFNALVALAWPLIALIVSAFWIIKAFKRIVFSA